MGIRLICIGIMLSIFLFIINCSTKGIHGYEPKSPDEEAIVSVLKKLEIAWTNDDIEGVLAVYHDDARIMWGGLKTGTMHTKAELEEALPGQMDRISEYRYVKPTSIKISGNMAEVQVTNILNSRGKYWRFFIIFDFVKENNQWLIINERY